MLGHNLPLVLLGFGATYAAPAPVPPSRNLPEKRSDVPPGCIPEVWELAQFCIIAPPISTIGPSNKLRDVFDDALLGDRGAITPDPTKTDGTCIPYIWDNYKFCIIAPPTTTIGPSDKRSGNTEEWLERREFTPGPTPTEGTCIPSILEKYKLCIIAPPITTIGPSNKKSKRQDFYLPPDGSAELKAYIASLEVQLIQLQNKDKKSAADLQKIDSIKKQLKVFGIVAVEAPDGVISTFVPGKKRDESVLSMSSNLPRAEAASACSNVVGVELALEQLMHKSNPSMEEYLVMKQLEHVLAGCGITIVKSPDGTTTIIRPGKRDTATTPVAQPDFDLTGLQLAYEVFLQQSSLSFDTWIIMQSAADVLELYGVPVDRAPAGATTAFTKRGGVFAIGTGQSCQVNDIVALKAALAALTTLYGDPARSPLNIFLIEQMLVTGLQACGQTVPGWTIITPGNPVPGGPLIPDPTVPGGPMRPDPAHPGGVLVPDPTVPGGQITPSDRRRGFDCSGLLATLDTLQGQYGTYGTGAIPSSVFLIMSHIVTILQVNSVSVPGWPILGGSTTIGPST